MFRVQFSLTRMTIWNRNCWLILGACDLLAANWIWRVIVKQVKGDGDVLHSQYVGTGFTLVYMCCSTFGSRRFCGLLQGDG
jgi:hypothetical protein